MEISFIVPVYNTETDKLMRCFTSFDHLSEVTYEVLIIDDGSVENIKKFCMEYVSAHTNFKYIGKVNGGVSSARNLGIRKAIGTYIYFVDSDDIIKPEPFIHEYMPEDSEIVFTDLMLRDGMNERIWKAFDKKPGIISVEDVLKHVTHDGKLNGPVCKLIKREFLTQNEIRFDERMILGEDAVFLLCLMKHSPIMYYVDNVSYVYFKEKKAGVKRLQMHPDIVLDNNIRMYKEMLAVIELQNYNDVLVNKMMIGATERYMKQLFNVGAGLINLKKFDDTIRLSLICAFRDIDQDVVTDCSLKAKIQYNVIVNNRRIVLLALSKLRVLYLRVKGQI